MPDSIIRLFWTTSDQLVAEVTSGSDCRQVTKGLQKAEAVESFSPKANLSRTTPQILSICEAQQLRVLAQLGCGIGGILSWTSCGRICGKSFQAGCGENPACGRLSIDGRR